MFYKKHLQMSVGQVSVESKFTFKTFSKIYKMNTVSTHSYCVLCRKASLSAAVFCTESDR